MMASPSREYEEEMAVGPHPSPTKRPAAKSAIRCNRNWEGRMFKSPRCEVCHRSDNFHFKIIDFSESFLCLKCGLVLKMFPTDHLSPAVSYRQPTNSIIKGLVKGVMVTALPLGVYCINLPTIIKVVGLACAGATAMTLFTGDPDLNDQTIASITDDAIDRLVYVTKRSVRSFATYFVSNKQIFYEVLKLQEEKKNIEVASLRDSIEALKCQINDLKREMTTLNTLQVEQRRENEALKQLTSNGFHEYNSYSSDYDN